MIIGARQKARNETEIAIGWQSERFARMKNVKPLEEYLKSAPAPAWPAEHAALGVKHMFDRMIAKQQKETS